MKAKRAFTLVELLVVIGIIALLISILLPSLNKAREAAKKTACLSNLRQIGMAMYMYANASKGYLPDPQAPTYDQWQAAWNVQLVQAKCIEGDLQQYRAPVFVCPSDSTPRNWGHPGSYWANVGHWQYMCGWIWGGNATMSGKAIRLTQMKNPAGFVLLYENALNWAIWGYQGYQQWYMIASLPLEYRIMPHGTKDDPYGSSILFGDGHAAWTSYDEQNANNYAMWSRSGVFEDLSQQWLQ